MRVEVVFERCRHNPKSLSHKTSFHYAVLSFSLMIDGTRHNDLTCLVQHPRNTEESNLIISAPAAYSGPFNLQLFRACAQDYYELCKTPVPDKARETDRVVVRQKAYSFETDG